MTGLSPGEQTEARLQLGRAYRQQLAVANAPTGGHGGQHATLASRNLEAFDRSPESPSAASQLRQVRLRARARVGVGVRVRVPANPNPNPKLR